MEVFYTTISIVFGILSPIIIVAAIVTVVIIGLSIPELLKLKIKEIENMPPYDEVETSYNPATRQTYVRFIKNNSVIWEGLVNVRD